MVVHALVRRDFNNHKKVIDRLCQSSDTQEVNYRTKGEQTYRRRRDTCKQLTTKRRCIDLWHDAYK